MNIRPVRTDEDHKAALREIDRLWGAAPGTDAGDKLDILVVLVERYEESRWPAPAAAPVEVLKFMMEQQGRTQADLGRLLGSRSRASEILNGRRSLGLEQIRTIARTWRIPVASLVGSLEPA